MPNLRRTALLLFILGVGPGAGFIVPDAAAQLPDGVTISATPNPVQAGARVRVFVSAPENQSAPYTGTVDPLGAGWPAFGVRLIGLYDLRDCPGQACLAAWVSTDILARPGAYTIPITLTGRDAREHKASVSVTVTMPADTDNDSMPDAWEKQVGLNWNRADGDDGPGGDPDGDGVANFDELQQRTHPRTRHFQYFAEASSGERQRLEVCFWVSQVEGREGAARIRLVGDDGRVLNHDFTASRVNPEVCPMQLTTWVADRVVAVVVESEHPVVVQRVMRQTADNWWGLTHVSPPVGAPSTQWHFAEGGGTHGIDAFYLAYNPNPDPVDATFLFYGSPGESPRLSVRTLPSGVRTTVWVNADEPRVSAGDHSCVVEATAPILVERAYRWNPPGKTVPHDSVSAGSAAPSATWFFPAVLTSRDAYPLETELVVANPSNRQATVEGRLFRHASPDPDLHPVVFRLTVPAYGRERVRLRDLGVTELGGVALESVTGVPVVVDRVESPGVFPRTTPFARVVPGMPQAGTQWALPNLGFGGPLDSRGLTLTNPTSVDATVELRAHALRGVDPVAVERVAVVTVPAFRSLRIPLSDYPSAGSVAEFLVGYPTLVMTSLPGATGRPVEFLAGLDTTVGQAFQGPMRLELFAAQRLR